MCKKLILLTSFVFVLVLVSSAPAELVAHWAFDEGSGDTVADSSGNNYHGTLFNDPVWVPGMYGSALNLEDGGYVAIQEMRYGDPQGGGYPGSGLTELSVFAWIRTSNAGNQFIVSFDRNEYYRLSIATSGGVDPGEVGWHLQTDAGGVFDYGSETRVDDGDWHHVGGIYDNGLATIYIDGEPEPSQTSGSTWGRGNLRYGFIGKNSEATGFNEPSPGGNPIDGDIDDVRIYHHALSEAEIKELAAQPLSYKPSPVNGAKLEDTWVSLSWLPGKHAVTHDVYLGDRFDDVNDGTTDSEVFRGNQATTTYIAGFPGFAYPDGLAPGTTYYWRIDDVDADGLKMKGFVWSFWIPAINAYNPVPADGEPAESTDIELTWSPGLKMVMNSVYFGTDRDQVAEGVGAPALMETTFDPGPLAPSTTYYWRVDTYNGLQWIKGDVWSFTTMPEIPLAPDPNLVAWYKCDEGAGSNLLDGSGHGNHGKLFGGFQWLSPGWIGESALDFSQDDGSYGAIRDFHYDNASGLAGVTVCAWIRTSSPEGQYIASFDRNEYWRLAIGPTNDPVAEGQVGWHVWTDAGQSDYGSITRVDDGQWHHVCGVFDRGLSTIYIEGKPEPSLKVGSTLGRGRFIRYGFIGANSEAVDYDGENSGGPPVSELDDLRIYDRALSQDEILEVMRGDPLLAWDLQPPSGIYDLESVPSTLTWKPGDKAAEHDVYFGTDLEAVTNADTSDTTGVYRGRQSGTAYGPPDEFAWDTSYFWRIDEFNTDGTITKGGVRAIIIADFILVDDFESYTNNDPEGEAIWQHWIDGFGVPDNGAQVGYLMPPYAEQTIVNGGRQSMPLLYNNTAGVTNSEAVLTLTAPRDWTKYGLTDLSLWFRGNPASVGSFTEAPAGTFTMTASGADIWGTADEFHYAFKTLTGAGSIVARVNSVENTHAWAKAGVMIRETLDAGSKHAFACVTPGNGVASQGRTTVEGTSFNTNQTGITAPHWVKAERDVTGNFTVSHSANGTTWESVENSIPTNIPMTSNVYIGLALTSHDASLTCQAVFSNVSTTGNVSGQWAHQDIGISSNAAEPMYIALSNSAGAPAIVAHEDPAAATIEEWTEWVIPLQAFADQGINLSDVDSIAIGLGSKAGVASSGGSGTIYIDDIRLYPPSPEPEPQP